MRRMRADRNLGNHRVGRGVDSPDFPDRRHALVAGLRHVMVRLAVGRLDWFAVIGDPDQLSVRRYLHVVRTLTDCDAANFLHRRHIQHAHRARVLNGHVNLRARGIGGERPGCPHQNAGLRHHPQVSQSHCLHDKSLCFNWSCVTLQPAEHMLHSRDTTAAGHAADIELEGSHVNLLWLGFGTGRLVAPGAVREAPHRETILCNCQLDALIFVKRRLHQYLETSARQTWQSRRM